MKTIYGSLLLASVCAVSISAGDGQKTTGRQKSGDVLRIAVLNHLNGEYSKIHASFVYWCASADYFTENYSRKADQKNNADRCVRLINALAEINGDLQKRYGVKRYDMMQGNYPQMIAAWQERSEAFKTDK